jgi:predicted lipoprotein with Yx(FWY)xxD motif
MRLKSALGVGAAVAALALAGCGGGGTKTSTSDGSATVAARDIAGIGRTLTNSAGNTLYFSDQESGGSIHCLDACVRFWTPLTVSTGAKPTAATGVTGTLGTVNRPDGSAQVTYDGKPLYTFTVDGGAGKAAGNGFKDSFDGTDFVWHAAAVSGTAPSAPDNGGGNGYGY